MANERQWDAVPPVLLIENGTTTGILQVADTIGFYFGMEATLKNNTSQLTVFVKMVVDKNTIYVGATKSGQNYNVDLSAFTVASDSTLSAAAQNKSAVPMEARLQASYETDPVDAWRIKSVDAYGKGYTDSNPLPTNLYPASQIPFTLGLLALPTLVSQYMATLAYTQVTGDTVGNEEVLRFYNGSTPVGEIQITKSPDGWVLNLGVPVESFLLLETGDFFELEDGSGGIELE